jgi:hypothetical protein
VFLEDKKTPYKLLKSHLNIIYMSKFLKLTKILLNTNDIHKIVIQPNKYCIHIVSKNINGFTWGIGGFGLGNISSYTSEIEVCKTNNSTDYKIVTDWIDNN